MFGTKSSAAVAFLMMLGGAALAFASQPGGTGAGETEVYRGVVDTRGWRGPVRVTLRVNSHSTDEDLRAIETTLADKGQEAMFGALAGMKINGWLSFEQDLGYPVTMLGEQPTGKGRRIVALVGRPLRFTELWWGAQSVRYPFTLIVLDVDGNGVGHGTLVPAARARLDKQGNIAFDDYLPIPYRILRVREDPAVGS